MFGNLLDILMLVFTVKKLIIIVIIIIFVKDGRDSYTPFKSGFTYKYSLLTYRYLSCGFWYTLFLDRSMVRIHIFKQDLDG